MAATHHSLLTLSAIETIAAAVFDTPDAWVAEANSDFDALPRQFATAAEFVAYTTEKLAKPKGSASFFVVYPDMAGRAVRQTIHLKPGSVAGHSLRYTWEGWGLISVLLTRGDQANDVSRVSANSEKRALNWASSYPGMEAPGAWNWKAVANHSRRLQRVLKQVMGNKALPTDVVARVQSDFAEAELAEVLWMLETYRGPEATRLLRCMVHLANGSIEQLRHHLQTAALDYRDVIFLAEYDGNEQRIHDFTQDLTMQREPR